MNIKDPELTGLYVKRCKPYYDRIAIGYPTNWIKCNCGRTGLSENDKQLAIDNWNKDILDYE